MSVPQALSRRAAGRLAACALVITAACAAPLARAAAGGWQCWADAATRYDVPVDLLYSIARVESGNRAGIVSRLNANGTYDIGLMQINSSHLPRLRALGITEKSLLTDPCLNLNVGAWILSEMVGRYGYTWQAIAAYNAGSPTDSGKSYALKVYAMYDQIVSERAAAVARAATINRERKSR